VIRRGRSSGHLRMSLLAGWLFADLFVVLFIVSLASLPTTAATHRLFTVPSPTRSPVSVLDQTPITFDVDVSPTAVENPATRPAADAELLRSLNGILAARGLLDKRAGFVLVFASAPATAISQAVAAATSIVGVIRARDQVFARTSGEGYWSGSGSGFEFQIFFFA
jgi:hypothetical protein